MPILSQDFLVLGRLHVLRFGAWIKRSFLFLEPGVMEYIENDAAVAALSSSIY